MRKFIDLTGQVFGRYEVVSLKKLDLKGHTRWLCHCICGKLKVVQGGNLKSGHTQSCGCFNKEKAKEKAAATRPQVGSRSGKLLIVSIKLENSNGHAMAECLCDCGKKVILRVSSIKTQHTISCGCSRRIHHTAQQVGEGIIISSYKNSAVTRKFLWSLSDMEAIKLFNSPCFYCGALATNCKKTTLGIFQYNGIDRVNNSEGYTPENTVPCCKQCNYSKGGLSQDSFLTWIQRVTAHQKKMRGNKRV